MSLIQLYDFKTEEEKKKKRQWLWELYVVAL